MYSTRNQIKRWERCFSFRLWLLASHFHLPPPPSFAPKPCGWIQTERALRTPKWEGYGFPLLFVWVAVPAKLLGERFMHATCLIKFFCPSFSQLVSVSSFTVNLFKDITLLALFVVNQRGYARVLITSSVISEQGSLLLCGFKLGRCLIHTLLPIILNFRNLLLLQGLILI